MTSAKSFTAAVSALCLCLGAGAAVLPALADTPPAQVSTPASTSIPAADIHPEGTWAGQSTCGPTAGWCEDEQMVIRIQKNAQPLTYDVEMNSVSGGVETPENHMQMVYKPAMHTLTARLRDNRQRLNFWVLAVKGDNMAGVLLIDDRTIERTLKLTRQTVAQVPVPAPAPAPDTSAASSAAPASPSPAQ
ncbi:MAG: hypothetical protein ACXU8U_00520 [Asticcacaulis sp.]